MDARSKLKHAYYEILWQGEPELRNEYRRLLDAPPEAQLQGAQGLIQRWKLPNDALAEILLALRRRDAGSEQESPLMPVVYEVQRPNRALPAPPPSTPPSSTLPIYTPDAYSTFGQYLQALERAYEGLECPTPAEQDYLQEWRRFTAGVGECLPYPEPPYGLPEYNPLRETREQYLQHAVAQVEWGQVLAGVPYAEQFTDAERREYLRASLTGYTRATEEWYRQAGYRLRRERNRELNWAQAQEWAEWAYRRWHKREAWKVIAHDAGQDLRIVAERVSYVKKVLGV